MRAGGCRNDWSELDRETSIGEYLKISTTEDYFEGKKKAHLHFHRQARSVEYILASRLDVPSR